MVRGERGQRDRGSDLGGAAVGGGGGLDLGLVGGVGGCGLGGGVGERGGGSGEAAAVPLLVLFFLLLAFF